MVKIEIKEDGMAFVRVGAELRTFPTRMKDGHPEFVEAVRVGVRIGKAGTKVWQSALRICKNDRYAKYSDPKMARLAGVPEYILDAYSPLNTINRDFVNVQILQFWDLVKEESKSRR